MASITIRNLDNEVETQLRKRAIGHGRSVEKVAPLCMRQLNKRILQQIS